MASRDEVARFYDQHYDVLGFWLLKPGEKVMLGDTNQRVCRFCQKRPPAVTFKKMAHAMPESMGNKSLESAYECDDCNQSFGSGIENDFGNWSKPMRTFARIRGKSGVPTLKKGGPNPGWRVEFDDTGLKVSSYEDEPLFEVDEPNKKATFHLRRDAYTPVGVLKTFMKIGLTLLPESEVENFPHLMAWVREKDHSLQFAEQCPVIYQFQPGPMPNDVIAAFILRRKPGITDYPYAYLVVGYGNEVFQVQLPSEKFDRAMNGKTFSIHPFPTPGSPFPDRFPSVGRKQLDFTGREVVRGEIFDLIVGYEEGGRKRHGSNTRSTEP